MQIYLLRSATTCVALLIEQFKLMREMRGECVKPVTSFICSVPKKNSLRALPQPG